MHRLIAGLAALTASSFVMVPPVSASRAAHHHVSAQHFVYFNSDHHIYRAPASDPARRISLHVADRPDVIVSAAAISPNGKRIAENLTYFDFSGHQHIPGCIKPQRYVCDALAVAHADGSHIRWLYTEHYGPTTPGKLAWAPDSRTLYFGVTYVEFPHHGDAHLMSIHLGRHAKPRRVPGGDGLINPSVSPNGKTLAAVKPNFDSDGFSSHASLAKLNRKTGKVGRTLLRTTLGPGERVVPFQDPRWSPNGKTIAVVLANPKAGPQDNERSVIELVAADGSDHAIAHVVASGGHTYYLHDPFWRANHEIWYSRNFQSFGTTDNERHSSTADLFSVNVHGHDSSKATRRTNTKTVNEHNPSFAR